MAKKRSKRSEKPKKLEKPKKSEKSAPYKHRSFRRSYREDYRRELKIPGVAEHAISSLTILFKNWRIFGPFLLLMTIVSWLMVGFTWAFNEVTVILGTLVILVIWLTTIFLLRQLMAKHKVSLRDGLYNAMTPLIATLVVFVVIVIQSLPIMILIIVYSAAVQTNFLTTPFYIFLFLGFASLMIVISGYFLSSSLIALVAVTAPGLYPLKALRMASELILGRRMRFLYRLVMLMVMLAAIWIVVMLPFLLLRLPTEFMTGFATVLMCFSVMYISSYLYRYYRYLLDA